MTDVEGIRKTAIGHGASELKGPEKKPWGHARSG